MKTLKFVRDIKDTSLLSLGIEGEESVNLTVNLGTFAEIGSPSVGDALDDGQMEILLAYDEYHRAMKKALNILAYRDNNRFSLKSKLIHAGFGREACERVTEEMVERGYINERDQLERIITVEANTKLRGPMKIIPTLVAKGYSSSDVRSVMTELTERGEVDFKANAKALLNKKLPDAEGEERKKFLYKHGYKI
jgi:SOS response regulatory protein OraA/RecX